jgi:hypothetical protein
MPLERWQITFAARCSSERCGTCQRTLRPNFEVDSNLGSMGALQKVVEATAHNTVLQPARGAAPCRMSEGESCAARG